MQTRYLLLLFCLVLAGLVMSYGHCPVTGARIFFERHDKQACCFRQPDNTGNYRASRSRGKAQHHFHSSRCSGLSGHRRSTVRGNPRSFHAFPHNPPHHAQAFRVQGLCNERSHPARIPCLFFCRAGACRGFFGSRQDVSLVKVTGTPWIIHRIPVTAVVTTVTHGTADDGC